MIPSLEKEPFSLWAARGAFVPLLLPFSRSINRTTKIVNTVRGEVVYQEVFPSALRVFFPSFASAASRLPTYYSQENLLRPPPHFAYIVKRNSPPGIQLAAFFR